MNKIKETLKSRRGEVGYISTVVYVLIVVMFISLIINLFSIISAKQQMDSCADQLTRQIQLVGEVNEDTDTLFYMLCDNMEALNNLSYEIETEYISGTNKIQLGTPFKVTITGEGVLGGFGDVAIFTVDLKSVSAGVSEEYHK